MGADVNLRLLALEALLKMEKEGGQSHLVIRDILQKYDYLSHMEKAFFQRLCEGTTEKRLQLDYLIDLQSRTPVRRMKPVIRSILRLSAYQLIYMDAVPDSAVVNEGVRLAVRKGFGSLRGFVNGVLRSMIRSFGEADKEERKKGLSLPGRDLDPVSHLELTYSIPEFLVCRWLSLYGMEETERICRSFSEDRPLTLRVREGAMKRVLGELEERGCCPERVGDSQAIRARIGESLTELASFREGLFLVQDLSSQIAVLSAGIRPGDLVVDVCAAPGGKTLLASDLTGEEGRVISRDISEARMQRVWENIQRWGCRNVTLQIFDACLPDEELRGRADVVLADLPCSGYGVIGRKADIRYGASRDKEEALMDLQRKILGRAADLVRPGGILVFSTCTFGSPENEAGADWIRDELGLIPDRIEGAYAGLIGGSSLAEGRMEILPGQLGCDGFFFARFRRPGGGLTCGAAD